MKLNITEHSSSLNLSPVLSTVHLNVSFSGVNNKRLDINIRFTSLPWLSFNMAALEMQAEMQEKSSMALPKELFTDYPAESPRTQGTD